jgi:long-chain-fatty-acyl-CoA reductase
MARLIDLPIMICGELKYPADDYIEIDYSNGVTARITRPSAEDFERIFSYAEPLHLLPIEKVSRYLSTFGRSFSNPSNPIRREAVELSAHVTGYSKEMLERDYAIISAYLSPRFTSYEVVESELGDHRILDEWVRRKVARVRAFPRGRALHVLVGNVPLTGIYSVFRSILTKNQTIAKLPSRDIISTLYFMRGLIDANSDGEPYRQTLNRSLSAFYLDSASAELKRLIEASDVVCAWGKGRSLKSIKEKVPHSTPYLEGCDLDKAAVRMAHDVSIYDQEACLCAQRLFIIGEYREYVAKLEKWLAWQARYLPRGSMNPDVESHILRTELEARFRKWPLLTEGPPWRIVVCDPYSVGDHPLGRTLFVHPVGSEEEILPFIDEETQAISIFPYQGNIERLGDLFCARGACKICETGMSMYPREGWTHDGMYPLQYLVRLCYLDENMGWEYKYEEKEGALAFLYNMYGKPSENYEEFIRQFPVPR